ncbi:MAG: cation transporter [Flavobacteriaceae bacterium]|jgi:copper chaperone CopZ|nr:cation transporter [Flavobacteriaceae bacterium]RZP06995.1 MAG: metal transporter [Flavobacteriales bacterium]
MKYIITLSLLFSTIVFSQENSSKSENVTFTVQGVCSMCKARIETGVIRIKGVKYANWDVLSNKISLIYNSKKIKIDDIHKKISLLGHSTEKYEAPEEIYNSLPECCRYKTNQPH